MIHRFIISVGHSVGIYLKPCHFSYNLKRHVLLNVLKSFVQSYQANWLTANRRTLQISTVNTDTR